MQTDLERERKAMTRLRAKREGQIREVIESTVGMCDDVQGIAGKALEEIDGLAQMARRVEARRKRGVTTHRVTEPNGGRGRTHLRSRGMTCCIPQKNLRPSFSGKQPSTRRGWQSDFECRHL